MEETPVSIVLITHGRCSEALTTVERLRALPAKPKVIVVDNASADGTAQALRQRFPDVLVVGLPRNIGAAARNEGVARVTTRYVAFCDDDTWWQPGALPMACALLDAFPRVGVITGRLLVGAQQREDPTCALMHASPLRSEGVPGRAILGFFAGACVMRVTAFRAVGGYERRLFLGCEEALMALDLAALGWHMAYVPELVCHHYPSTSRDPVARRRLLARNHLLITWLRLSVRESLRETLAFAHAVRRDPELWPAVASALRALPWVLADRRVVPPAVEEMRRQVAAARRAHGRMNARVSVEAPSAVDGAVAAAMPRASK